VRTERDQARRCAGIRRSTATILAVEVDAIGEAQDCAGMVPYAGAKRMLWIMAKSANGISQQKGLGIRFQAIVPLQIIGGTGVGDAGANAYARAIGVNPEEFLARFGAPLPPREFGEKVVSLLDDPKYSEGIAFGLKGDTGITVLEGEAA
jgi:hypothetical protein